VALPVVIRIYQYNKIDWLLSNLNTLMYVSIHPITLSFTVAFRNEGRCLPLSPLRISLFARLSLTFVPAINDSHTEIIVQNLVERPPQVRGVVVFR
jgi:hypothetical protein